MKLTDWRYTMFFWAATIAFFGVVGILEARAQDAGEKSTVVQAAEAQTAAAADPELTSPDAHYKRRPYLAGRVHYNIPDLNNIVFNHNISGAFALGGDLNKYLRAEVEVSRKRSDIKQIAVIPAEGDVEARSVLAQLFVDFRGHDKRIRPYVGLGAGVARLEALAAGANSHRPIFLEGGFTKPAYQASWGLSAELFDKTVLELGGAYFETQNIVVNGEFLNGRRSEGFYRTYSAYIGMRRKF